MMQIQCETLTQFLDVIAGLVHRGLTFKANSDTYKIELLGGY
jgi:hypothetical protein